MLRCSGFALTLPGAGGWSSRRAAARLQLTPPPLRPGLVSRARLIGAAQSECVPRRRHQRAGWLRQVDAAGRVGDRREPRRCLGVARPLRRRPRRPSHLAGLGLRPHLSPVQRPDCGCRRPRRVSAGSRRASSRFCVQGGPGAIRDHARRPARAPVGGLPRCAQRGDRQEFLRLPAHRSEPFRATSPAAPACVG